MKIFSAKQIRSWDEYSILHEPITALALMERAASACYNWIKQELPLLENETGQQPSSLKIFCGKGNNGGDGLALARMLLENGIVTSVYVLETGSTGTEAFETNFQALNAKSGDVKLLRSADDFPTIKESDILIDALFGTGLNKPLAGFAAQLVTHLNQSNAGIISIDLPSGLFADESSKGNVVVCAKYTLSFQCHKLAFLVPENDMFVGSVTILDIGLHTAFNKNEPAKYYMLTQEIVKRFFRHRQKFAHKGNYGHAMLVAGSYGKAGAAVLAANACLRSGVGLLTVHVPETACNILQVCAPEAMVVTEKTNNYELYHVAGIGPGMGTSNEAVDLFIHLLNNCNQLKNYNIERACCLVADADALNILAMQPDLLLRLPAFAVLTPHPKEFERLFGKTIDDFDRFQLALSKARQLNCVIVLKGHHSFVATPEGLGYFNTTGNPGMATGGSGDVLTGLITGLAAQGYGALESCLLAVYLHGLAGDLAAAETSQEAMLAGDIIKHLGQGFKQFY